MPKTVKIGVRKRFQRSVNLVADYGTDSAVRDFVVSPLAWETSCRFTAGVGFESGNRAWALVGPYGSGKSSFAAFFANLISPDGRHAAMRKIRAKYPDEIEPLKRSLKALGSGLVPVLVVGERAPFAQVLVGALETTLTRLWNRPGRSPAVITEARDVLGRLESGATVSDSTVVNLFVDGARAVQRAKFQGDGLCLILDEFGKSLEWAALHPSRTDLYLLQLLAEAAGREDVGKLMLITIQHQGIEAYANRLSVQQQREWEKVAGRFETVPYLESPRHLAQLVGEAINITGNPASFKCWNEHQRASKRLTKLVKGQLSEVALAASFPLHPAVALVLGPLFRLDFGQNERSLFSFLSSREPGAFQSFLEDWHDEPDRVGLFSLSNLYDYILANTRAALSTSPESRAWGTAEEALRRLPRGAGQAEANVIKAVTILNLVGGAVGLVANRATIEGVLSNAKARTSDAIQTLEDASILLYRNFKSAYQLWDGSDLDVGTLLTEGRNRVFDRGNLASQLEEVHTLPPFLAARHYLESGTLRSFECRFLSGNDHRSLGEYTGAADGLVGIVLPERDCTVQKSLDGTEFAGKPVLSLHLEEDTPLVETTLDFLGAREALRSTSELENDPIARRALEELMLNAWDRLQEQLTRAFHGNVAGAWHWNGRVVKDPGSLSNLASRALDKAYEKAPNIHNELLNRASLSSAAAAARRALLERLLLHAGEERLGIEGHPPELSMYLSVIQAAKIHRKRGGAWQLAKPIKTSPLLDLWRSLDELFDRYEGARLSLQKVYDRFTKPPYGVRQGLLPVLIFCYLLVNRETAFLYEDGTFIPAIEKDHVQRFLSRPQTFDVQKLVLNPQARTALAGARYALDLPEGEDGLLPTVRTLIGTASSLSSYARQTQHISERTRRLRAALFSARDPIHLLRDSIPAALEVGQSSKETRSELAPRLREALNELRTADQRLTNELRDLLLQAFGRGAVASVDFRRLRERAEAINLEAFPIQPLARVVQVFSELGDHEPDENWLMQFGLALVGKPVPQWRDEDLPIFRSVLFESARQFAAAEAGSIHLRRPRPAPNATAGGSLTSIAWLTSDGGYDTAVAHLTPELQEQVERLLPELQALARRAALDLRELLTATIVRESGAKQPETADEAFAVEV